MLRNDPHVGAPRSRVDGPAKVTGAATYAAEFDAPGLLHAYVVGSAIAKGKIASLDVSAAEALPGVVAVFWHKKRPAGAWRAAKYRDDVGPPGKPLRPLYNAEIHYSGQPIALVVAESFEIARHARRWCASRIVPRHTTPTLPPHGGGRPCHPGSATAFPALQDPRAMPRRRNAARLSRSPANTGSQPSITIRWSRMRRPSSTMAAS